MLNIFPNPVASYSTNNVCFGSANQFVNQSTVSGGIAIYKFMGFQWRYNFDTG